MVAVEKICEEKNAEVTMNLELLIIPAEEVQD